jgi:enoyl-CoA hydratase
MLIDNLLLEIRDGVAIITVNRPEKMNALSKIVLAELEHIFNELRLDNSIRVIIVTGGGEKAFVAGGDIKELASMAPNEAHQFALSGQRVLRLMAKIPKPIIAAVNGYALGGGFELALGCDFIYASTNAKIGLPEGTLGVIPGFGGTQNLARLIGKNKAKEMIFSGSVISAEKAYAWGIVNEVYLPNELLEKAVEVGKKIAQLSSTSVGYAKDAINNGTNMTCEDGFRYEAALFGVIFSTNDQKEGMNAFVNKRKANFTGN